MAWAADATEASRGGNRPWGAGVLGVALHARSLPLEDTERADVVKRQQTQPWHGLGHLQLKCLSLPELLGQVGAGVSCCATTTHQLHVAVVSCLCQTHLLLALILGRIKATTEICAWNLGVSI